MAPRESAVQRGKRIGRTQRRRIADEFRIARLSAGLSQRELGRMISSSHMAIGRLERAEVPNLSVDRVAIVAAVLGLNAYVGLYPEGSPLRDAAHLALIERLRRRLGDRLRLMVEVSMPLPGDLRSADGVIEGAAPRLKIMVEAETRIADVQALLRRVRAKQRDLGCDRLILLLSDTRHNRAVLVAHPGLRVEFPVDPRASLRALADSNDPGGDALVLL